MGCFSSKGGSQMSKLAAENSTTPYNTTEFAANQIYVLKKEPDSGKDIPA